MAVVGSEDAVRSVVMDYAQGWFEGEYELLPDDQRKRLGVGAQAA